MSKTYQIELKINDSQAQAANERQLQGMTRIERAALRSAEMQERQAQKSAAARERAEQRVAEMTARQAQKTADAKARAEQRAADVAERQAQKSADAKARAADRVADREARAAERAADAKVRADQRAIEGQARRAQRQAEQQARADQRSADAKARNAQRAADVQVAAAQKAQARIDAMSGRALTEEEVRAKGTAAVWQRLNDRRVAMSTKAAEAERRAAMSVREKFVETASTLVDQVNPAAVAFGLATAAVTPIVQGVLQNWRNVTAEINASAKAAVDLQNKSRTNAGVGGNLGNVTKEAKESLSFRSKTLQDDAEARAFVGGALNMGASSVGTRITKEEFEKLKIEGGKFQASEGGDATTHGELVGRLPSLINLPKDAKGQVIPATADQVMAEMSKLKDILDMGGSEYAPGVGQLLKNSSLTQTGTFKDIHEQAALQSYFSKARPAEAGEMVDWATRATVGSLKDKDVGPYLAGLGAKEGQTPTEILKLISGNLSREQAHARIRGEAYDPMVRLREKGYTREEDMKAITAFHAGSESGEFAPFDKASKAPATTATIDAGVANFQATAAGQIRKADIASESARQIVGSKAAKDLALYRAAHAKLVAEKKLGGSFEDDWGNTWGQQPAMIASEAQEILEGSARRNGATVSPNDPFTSSLTSHEDRIKKSNEDLNSIGAQGGDPIGETMDYVNLLKDEAMTAEEAKEKVNRDARLRRQQRQKAAAAKAQAPKPAAPGLPGKVAALDGPPLFQGVGSALMTVAARAGQPDDGSGIMTMELPGSAQAGGKLADAIVTGEFRKGRDDVQDGPAWMTLLDRQPRGNARLQDLMKARPMDRFGPMQDRLASMGAEATGPGSMATPGGPVDQALGPLLQQLIALTQQQLQVMKADKHPDPLPISGMGRRGWS